MYLQLSVLPTFAITILQKSIEWVSNPVFSVQCSVFRFFPRKFNVLFKFNYSKYNPRRLIFGGGLIFGRSFPFQKLVPKRPGAYTRWGLYYRNFTVYPLLHLWPSRYPRGILPFSLRGGVPLGSRKSYPPPD